MPAVSPARAAAFDILLRVERESSYASELLHSDAYKRFSAPDHALATELVMGVLRWCSRLDDEIAGASSQPLEKLDLEILIALRLAVYQFLWLDRIPQHAALNESVELVKRARKRSAAPFVNAVLRKITKRTDRRDFPVQEMRSAEDLASSYAHPLWLVERWAKQYGFSAASQICLHDQSIPGVSFRLRSSDAEKELVSERIAFSLGRLLSFARRVESGEITHARSLRAGHAVIQDEASQLVAALAGCAVPKHETRILDCCAAPGGKTLALADQDPQATVTAVEIHPHRARLMKKLLPSTTNTSGASIQIIAADARSLPLSVPFDRVLADVPCSGTGTLARNPEIKWRLCAQDLADLHQKQVEILRSALKQVAAGGRVIYSTCSLEKEENEDVVDEVLADNNSFRTMECSGELERLKAAGRLTWPDLKSLTRGPYLRTIPGVHPCDGFFGAILERI
jgi:16S rRNA (cytosine967-C5)-methyltransferase